VNGELLVMLKDAALAIAKPVASGLVCVVLAWGTVEWIVGLVPWVRNRDPRTKELIAGLLALSGPYLAHRTGLVDYGPGPDGWGTALLVGFFALGLAPWLHRQIKMHLPALTLPAKGA